MPNNILNNDSRILDRRGQTPILHTFLPITFCDQVFRIFLYSFEISINFFEIRNSQEAAQNLEKRGLQSVLKLLFTPIYP